MVNIEKNIKYGHIASYNEGKDTITRRHLVRVEKTGNYLGVHYIIHKDSSGKFRASERYSGYCISNKMYKNGYSSDSRYAWNSIDEAESKMREYLFTHIVKNGKTQEQVKKAIAKRRSEVVSSMNETVRKLKLLL
jgi:uncharacterized protein YdaT